MSAWFPEMLSKRYVQLNKIAFPSQTLQTPATIKTFCLSFSESEAGCKPVPSWCQFEVMLRHLSEILLRNDLAHIFAPTLNLERDSAQKTRTTSFR